MIYDIADYEKYEEDTLHGFILLHPEIHLVCLDYMDQEYLVTKDSFFYHKFLVEKLNTGLSISGEREVALTWCSKDAKRVRDVDYDLFWRGFINEPVGKVGGLSWEIRDNVLYAS